MLYADVTGENKIRSSHYCKSCKQQGMNYVLLSYRESRTQGIMGNVVWLQINLTAIWLGLSVVIISTNQVIICDVILKEDFDISNSIQYFLNSSLVLYSFPKMMSC